MGPLRPLLTFIMMPLSRDPRTRTGRRHFSRRSLPKTVRISSSQTYGGDGIPVDSDIAIEPRAAGAIDHLAAGDEDIEQGECRKAAQQEKQRCGRHSGILLKAAATMAAIAYVWKADLRDCCQPGCPPSPNQRELDRRGQPTSSSCPIKGRRSHRRVAACSKRMARTAARTAARGEIWY
jgi:hypothetical protein